MIAFRACCVLIKLKYANRINLYNPPPLAFKIKDFFSRMPARPEASEQSTACNSNIQHGDDFVNMYFRIYYTRNQKCIPKAVSIAVHSPQILFFK